MDNIITNIKKLERSQKSLRESVEKTCGALQSQVNELKDSSAICYHEECYEQGTHLDVNERWLCEKHWKDLAELRVSV